MCTVPDCRTGNSREVIPGREYVWEASGEGAFYAEVELSIYTDRNARRRSDEHDHVS